MGKIPMKRRLAILISLLVLSTSIGSAQKVSLNFSQTSLKAILESITQQTDYTLAFSKEVVDLNSAVNIQANDKEVEQVLDELLTSRNIGYEIKDNKIYIFEKPTAAVRTAQSPQQEVKINGQVIDDEGLPVIGANIVILGTSTGTITDLDGNYSLSVPRNSTLHISYIGYMEQRAKYMTKI